MIINENVRNVGEAKMLAYQKHVAEESANNNDCPHAPGPTSPPINKLTLLKTVAFVLNFKLWPP